MMPAEPLPLDAALVRFCLYHLTQGVLVSLFRQTNIMIGKRLRPNEKEVNRADLNALFLWFSFGPIPSDGVQSALLVQHVG